MCTVHKQLYPPPPKECSSPHVADLSPLAFLQFHQWMVACKEKSGWGGEGGDDMNGNKIDKSPILGIISEILVNSKFSRCEMHGRVSRNNKGAGLRNGKWGIMPLRIVPLLATDFMLLGMGKLKNKIAIKTAHLAANTSRHVDHPVLQ